MTEILLTISWKVNEDEYNPMESGFFDFAIAKIDELRSLKYKFFSEFNRKLYSADSGLDQICVYIVDEKNDEKKNKILEHNHEIDLEDLENEKEAYLNFLKILKEKLLPLFESSTKAHSNESDLSLESETENTKDQEELLPKVHIDV